MARCEICGAKLKNPNQMFCGGKKCTATKQLKRCIFCNALIKSEGQKCPNSKAPGHRCSAGGEA